MFRAKAGLARIPIPAIDRYDGQFFRILRKSGILSTKRLHVVILSAKFGFLSADTRIPWYDQKISPDQAVQLRSPVEAGFQALSGTHWHEIFVNLGRAYAPLVAGIPLLEPAEWASGPIGQRSRQLKTWLGRL